MQQSTAWMVGWAPNLFPSSGCSLWNEYDDGSRGPNGCASNAAIGNAQRKSVTIKPSIMMAG
jgi:hypothetical protein